MKRIALFIALCMLISLLPVVGTAETAPVKLTVVANPHGAVPDLNTSEYIKKMAAAVGVELEFDCVYSDWGVKKSTLLASGDLPDMFIGSAVLSESEILANIEYFEPLNDLIDAYAPNIKKAIEEDAGYRNMVTSTDGAINWLGSRNLYRPGTYTTLFINQVWLDKLGLTIPETTAELEEVLKAFRDGDPNGNGEADEIPLYMNMFRSDDAWGIRCFMGAFGVEASINTLFALEDGKVVFRPIQAGFKEYIKWLHELEVEGLAPEDLSSADWNTIMARVGSGEPLVGVTNMWSNPLFDETVRDQYVQMPPLAGPNGDRYVAYNPDTATFDYNPKFVLSAACENKEAAIKFIDQFFIGENAVQISIGPIGVMLIEEDGLLTMQQPPEGMDGDTWIYQNSMREQWPYYATDAWLAENLAVPYYDAQKLAYDAVNLPYTRKDSYLPPVKFTPEQQEELAQLVVDLEAYYYPQLIDWFVEGGVDEGWDDYLAEMEDIGVSRYIELYQEAYDALK